MGRLEKPGVDIRRLRYFVEVCDHRGFSGAAPVFTRAKDIRASLQAVF